jgi:hypothetical protein
MDAETYVALAGTLLTETSDYLFETAYFLETTEQGAVDLARVHGHTVDGAAFEFVFVRVTFVRDGRLSNLEEFAVEDEAKALARFAQLRAASID